MSSIELAQIMKAESGWFPVVIFLIIIAVNIGKAVMSALRGREESSQPLDSKKKSASATQKKAVTDEIGKFLKELTQQSGTPPSTKTQPRPTPRIKQKKKAAPKRLDLTKHHVHERVADRALMPHEEKRMPKLPSAIRAAKAPLVQPAKPKQKKQIAPAAAFAEALPKDALKRAIILREVLGPCRAMRPYKRLDW